MPMKMDDPKKTDEVVITRPCVAGGKPRKVGEKVTLALTDANFLRATRKAVRPEDYKPAPPKADKAPDKK